MAGDYTGAWLQETEVTPGVWVPHPIPALPTPQYDIDLPQSPDRYSDSRNPSHSPWPEEQDGAHSRGATGLPLNVSGLDSI